MSREKIAIIETIRHGAKALKQSLLGGHKLEVTPGIMMGAREQAGSHGKELISILRRAGHNIHRSRVKTPESIAGAQKNFAPGQELPNDLLGMQMYARTPTEAAGALKALEAAGVTIDSKKLMSKPSYYGVNVKGRYKGTPLELQFSPGRLSNAGQIMNHALTYKPKTEAPMSTFFDRWFGAKVTPKLVQDPRWAEGMKQLVN